ncbi:50S ribosomal protein L18-like isoform X1 [Carya illinoinensis]|uniref:50S ribosomal protein L18-like isoform X1 n=1 Tax=Carya illinoinensis TaxID=32201 RepID=UPI001C7194D3|nr:50S ribosomal protein L18-like isoform X1 [Carya illinoinensis]
MHLLPLSLYCRSRHSFWVFSVSSAACILYSEACVILSSAPAKLIRMVIPPPVRPPRITNYLKPYVLKMHFTNKYVSTQVIHAPTATVASSASSQEKALRPSMESTRDVAAAGKIGKILGERLLLKDIPAVAVHLEREQRYHGKVKAVIDSLREAGVKLL